MEKDAVNGNFTSWTNFSEVRTLIADHPGTYQIGLICHQDYSLFLVQLLLPKIVKDLFGLQKGLTIIHREHHHTAMRLVSGQAIFSLEGVLHTE